MEYCFLVQAHIYLVPSCLFFFFFFCIIIPLQLAVARLALSVLCWSHIASITWLCQRYYSACPHRLYSSQSESILTVSASMFSSFHNSEQSTDYHFLPFESHLIFEWVLGVTEMTDLTSSLHSWHHLLTCTKIFALNSKLCMILLTH
jgi:hypothetical protein